MSLRTRLADDLKAAMKSGDAARTSTVRLVIARIKETDISNRPKGIEQTSDDDLVAVLRSMLKQRHDSVALYRQGGREELARKEEAEIALIESYLPASLDGPALDAAVAAAVAETGATTGRDLGRVMAALKAAHGSALDMARAGAVARARLG